MALNIVDESTLTVAGASIGLSSASPTLAAAELLGARQAVITVKTAPVYYRQDGDNATSSDTILYPGDILNVLGDSMRSILTNLRFLRVGSTSATLVIRWYDRDVINVPIVSRGGILKRVPIITPTTGGGSTATAIATLAPTAAFHLLGVRIHFSAVLDAAETLTITKNSASNPYDTLLFTLDIGTPNIVDVKIPFGGEDDFYSATDTIVIALSANAQSRVWGCDTIHELV